jgi:hypothetical protein
MKNKLVVAALITAIAAPVLAQTVQRSLNLVLGTQASTEKALVIGGKTYVPVSSLRNFGITAAVAGNTVTLSAGAAGGANQVAALEGCLNQTLFNGVWRFTVKSLTTGTETRSGMPDRTYVEVVAEVRNGTRNILSFYDSGFQVEMVYHSFNIAFEDGTTTGVRDINFAIDRGIIPGGVAPLTMRFYPDANQVKQKVTKVIWLGAPAGKAAQLPYTTKDPSFRVNATCTK